MTVNDAEGPTLLPATAMAGRDEPVDRILATAYELFSRRGIRDVGVNELISSSGVSKATFYRHFPSKDALVLAFLELRDQVWTVDLIVAEASRRGNTPEERLLAVFDVFGDWFQREDFEAPHPWPPPRPGRGSRARPPRGISPVLAHPDERLHHFRHRRGRAGLQARPADGAMAHRAPPGPLAAAPGDSPSRLPASL